MFGSPEAVGRAVESGFGGGRVLVVGDLMLDSYLWGDVGRISPEAPVPVVSLTRRGDAPGGAGNVALNLRALGLAVAVAGLVGDDEAGRRLRLKLDEAGIDSLAVAPGDGRPTTTKTRVIAGHQQLIRIDEEVSAPATGPDQDRLLEAVRPLLGAGLAALVLSDYDKGAVTARVCRALIVEARRLGIPVVVDPKGRDFAKYAGATALTPNRHEFDLATGPVGPSEAAFRDAAGRLRVDLGLDFLAVTRGEKGLSLFDGRGSADFPAVAREVFDVSGAGDTLLATLVAGMAGGLDLDDALRLGNLAAGIVVGAVGTAAIRRADLLAGLRADAPGLPSTRVYTLGALARRAAEWRSRGERIVFTNGCFDLLHVGHVTLLAEAGRQGDRLVVGLNTDRSVRALKGHSRPATPQGDRARILASLAGVDAVVLFDEDTPRKLIEALRPDVLVKGADYSESRVVGADLVRSWGGRVVLVPLVEGRSTTKILGR